MDPAHLYELPTWRDPPGYGQVVTVPAVLAYLARRLGRVPAAVDDEAGVRAFADACEVPTADLDIEPDLHFPNRRWASRAWVRAEYARFHAWCREHGWLEAAPTPPPAKPKKKKEPAAA